MLLKRGPSVLMTVILNDAFPAFARLRVFHLCSHSKVPSEFTLNAIESTRRDRHARTRAKRRATDRRPCGVPRNFHEAKTTTMQGYMVPPMAGQQQQRGMAPPQHQQQQHMMMQQQGMMMHQQQYVPSPAPSRLDAMRAVAGARHRSGVFRDHHVKTEEKRPSVAHHPHAQAVRSVRLPGLTPSPPPVHPLRMPPQQQMHMQPQGGDWKAQLNIPLRDERYRTEVRFPSPPTRFPGDWPFRG